MSITSLDDIDVSEWLGQLVVRTGCMRTDKTSESRNLLQKLGMLTRHHSVQFVTTNDTRTVCDRMHRRTGMAPLSSADGHDSKGVWAHILDDPSKAFEIVRSEDREIEGEFGQGHYADVVYFEEPNLFDHRLIRVIREMRLFDDKPRLVLTAGLDKTFTQEPFGVMGWCIGSANWVIRKFARCTAINGDGYVCGKPTAQYTARLLNRSTTGFEGPELKIIGKGGVVISDRTPAPFFDLVMRPEQDGSTPENQWDFNYAPMCVQHFPRVPFETETRAIYRRALELALANRKSGEGIGVPISRLKEEFDKQKHLDAILLSLATDRGFVKQGDLLVPKTYVKGDIAGLYINQDGDIQF